MSAIDDAVTEIVTEFVDTVESDLVARWHAWHLDLGKNEMHETVGALLARQVTLAQIIAVNPGTWNEHVGPIFLRCMADVYISLAWILEEPLERSRLFIRYGLGQAKLQIEHRTNQLRQDGLDPDTDRLVISMQEWVNSQRYLFLTEVNLGTWSDLPVRRMAEEANCLDFYNYVYTPFSAAVHSTWQHIGRINMMPCLNPLHRAHHIPTSGDVQVHPHYLLLAGKYLDKTFRLFDSKVPLNLPASTASASLRNSLAELKSTDVDARAPDTEDEAPNS